MKYYLIAGEASGDMHAARLMEALQKQDPDAHFRYWGGDRMQAQGGVLVKHYRHLAFMGFWEVLMHLPTILKNIAFCKRDIQTYRPDVIVFIDYPGFNLRIARWAKKQGYKTHYYIAPQLWAWKENRIKAIKRDIDAMYVILPFEKDFYEKKHHFPVHFVGHPLLDAIAVNTTANASFRARHQLNDRPIIALLPGSRKQEIKKMLPVMLEVVADFPGYQFVIAGAPNQPYNMYKHIIKSTNASYVDNDTYSLLSAATAAVVTSGTATLETALFKVPQVVGYKGSWLSYQIAKRVITLSYISLVNLIMNEKIVTELIQRTFTAPRLKEELKNILNNPSRSRIITGYEALEKKLGDRGVSHRVATLLYKNSSS